jgi:replicative superfamily II helicase
MVGRAGRLGLVETGKSFVVAMNVGEEHKVWSSYVLASPEDLHSRFGSGDILSTITRVLATIAPTKAQGMQTQDIIAFLQNSLAAIQRSPGTESWTQQNISRSITDLERNGLIESNEHGYRLTALGRLSGESGVEVSSIMRLSAALRGIPASHLTDENLLFATQATVELDDVYFPLHKKSHQENGRWRDFARQRNIAPNIRTNLDRNVEAAHEATARFKRGTACTLWIDGIDIKQMEENLLQHIREKNAAGAIRTSASRTRDLLPITAQVAEIISGNSVDLGKRVEELLVRLELGISSDLTAVSDVFKNSISRSDYLSLRSDGVSDLPKLMANPNLLDTVITDRKKLEAMKKQLIQYATEKTKPEEE